jgi:D-alanyl-D-alanine carboxypeptidase/D-alanyl-D-alanine-endopeptidase (penicillin-binding protein 4)
MKRFPFGFLLALFLCPALVHAELGDDIRSVLNNKLFAKGEIGIQIIRLGSKPGESKIIYELKPTTPRIPASNLKLVTTATALEKLGADFQFKTVLAMRGRDLAIIGDGDPTMGDAELLKKVGWGTDTVFKAWAEMLKSHGISEVGDVYVDDSIFDENFMHPSWPPEQQHFRYVAQVAGLNFNANCVDFYLQTTGMNQVVNYRLDPPTSYVSVRNSCQTGSDNAVWLSRQLGGNNIVLRGETNANSGEPVSVTIHDPSLYGATVLAETLASNGIAVKGTVGRNRTIRALVNGTAPATQPSDRWVPLAVHATPLASVLARTNKDSMNLYAESLCKRVGAAATGQSGSWENGTATVGAFLKSLGVDQAEFSLDDGCGLSKKNQISPHAIVKVLERKFYESDRDTYLKSLSVGGVDGTLKDRFSIGELRGRVFGKSGYVIGVRSLSGYLQARNGEWYAFSILMNALPESDWGVKPAQDKIIQALDVASGSSTVASGQ